MGYEIYDPNGPGGQTGFAPYLFTIKNGKRWTTADGYLRPAVRSRPNLHVALNTQVRKVLFDDKVQTKRATGVQVSQDGGHTVFDVSSVILFLVKMKA